MGEQTLTIRQLAQAAGVSSRTLRHWESRGLIPLPRRTHTNYRLYTEADRERVLFIRKAQSLGFTLAEIRRIFDLARSRTAPCDAVLQWTGEKIQALEDQIHMLQDLKERLEQYRRQWATEGVPSRLGPNDVCRCIASVPLEELKRPSRPFSQKGGEQNAS